MYVCFWKTFLYCVWAPKCNIGCEMLAKAVRLKEAFDWRDWDHLVHRKWVQKQERAAWRGTRLLGTRHIKNCRSIIWSVAVVLDFAEAIPTLYLFSLLPKSTNIVWFLAPFYSRLPSAPGKEAFSISSGLLFNTVTVTLALLRVNWASADTLALGIVLSGWERALSLLKNVKAEPLGEAFNIFHFQKRMTTTEIYKILKHSNLKLFNYWMQTTFP